MNTYMGVEVTSELTDEGWRYSCYGCSEKRHLSEVLKHIKKMLPKDGEGRVIVFKADVAELHAFFDEADGNTNKPPDKAAPQEETEQE